MLNVLCPDFSKPPMFHTPPAKTWANESAHLNAYDAKTTCSLLNFAQASAS